jgi:hypothetical protein
VTISIVEYEAALELVVSFVVDVTGKRSSPKPALKGWLMPGARL